MVRYNMATASEAGKSWNGPEAGGPPAIMISMVFIVGFFMQSTLPLLSSHIRDCCILRNICCILPLRLRIQFISMVHLGNNIARLRGFRRMTQKELADKLNMSQQEYSRLENKEQIDDAMLELISKAMDFPVDLIKQLDTASVVNHNQQGGNAGNIFYQTGNPDHIVELYDKLIDEKDATINRLEKLLAQKDEVIQMYQTQQKAS